MQKDTVSEIIGIETVDKKWLDARPDLKVLGVCATGLDHIDLEECERRGIKVISLGIKGTRSVEDEAFIATITSTAEHTIGLMIALLRKYKMALNEPYFERDYYKGHTLARKTLGIVGCLGRIGRQVARIARGFDMELMGYDVYGLPDDVVPYYRPGIQSSLTRLLSNADIITIHIPLSGNKGFFTKEMFSQMKPTAFFINTSRSDIVELGALLEALKNKWIAGAAVDFVYDPELVKYASNNDNLILTNHLGGATFEDQERTKNYIQNKVDNYLKTNH